jgi:hypothetical protein
MMSLRLREALYKLFACRCPADGAVHGMAIDRHVAVRMYAQ